jgi:hypothetical protein
MVLEEVVGIGNGFGFMVLGSASHNSMRKGIQYKNKGGLDLTSALFSINLKIFCF